MTEFLLAELCRVPTSDRMDTREAMALSSGWALGMVLLGCKAKMLHNQNSTVPGQDNITVVSLHRIEDRLENLIDGGRRPDPATLFPVS
jgi:hypothetical protein